MKKEAIILLAAMSAILTLDGCRKDNNENIDEETLSHRIIAEKYYSGDLLSGEGRYEYIGNKISRYNSTYISDAIIQDVNVNVYEDILIEYPDENRITGSSTLKYDGVIQDVSEIEIKLVKNKATEFINGEFRTTITYNTAGQIEEIIEYESDILRSSYTYSYSSDKMIKEDYVEYAGSQIFQYKKEYSYTGEEINQRISFQKEGETWIPIRMDRYTYVSAGISDIQVYIFESTNWRLTLWHYTYAYDNFGNLIEEGIYEGPESIEKTKYSYEEGSGNFRQIFGAFYDFSIDPMPNKKSKGNRYKPGTDSINNNSLAGTSRKIIIPR